MNLFAERLIAAILVTAIVAASFFGFRWLHETYSIITDILFITLGIIGLIMLLRDFAAWLIEPLRRKKK